VSARRSRTLLMALAPLAVLACSQDARPEFGEGAPSVSYAEMPPDGIARERMGLASQLAPAPAPAAAQSDESSATSRLAGTMLIRNGDVGIRVDSLEPAMAAVRALAERLGGLIGNVMVTGGEERVRSAVLELRVPAARFDSAMSGLAPIGRVEHSATTAEDVGEEYVDRSARLANGRRLESRLVSLLATQAGKLEDVLAVERELARVRGEIEQHEGRLRYLSARVATSTIQVRLSERAPLVSEPGRSVLGDAFVAAWRNFVWLVSAGIASLGIVLPLGVLAWSLLRLVRRRRRMEE
jgi:hypothetical protein